MAEEEETLESLGALVAGLAKVTTDHEDDEIIFAARWALNEIKRLREYEWKYKDLCE